MNNEELTLDYHEHASQMHEGMDFNSDVWQGIPDVPTEEEDTLKIIDYNPMFSKKQKLFGR